VSVRKYCTHDLPCCKAKEGQQGTADPTLGGGADNRSAAQGELEDGGNGDNGAVALDDSELCFQEARGLEGRG